MSSQRRGTPRSTTQRKAPVQRSATTMKNIAYLMRNSSKKLTEREAKLFLTKLQRKYPGETINVTKTGKIFSVGKSGTVRHIGMDGRPIRPARRVTKPLDLPHTRAASITAAKKPRYTSLERKEKTERSTLYTLTGRIGKRARALRRAR